jgi:hypothetical protein
MLKTLNDERTQVDNAYEFETKVNGVYRIRMGTAYGLQKPGLRWPRSVKGIY